MNLVDFMKKRAKEFGNKIFLWEKKNSLTFKEFDQVTDRLAAGLQYLGVKKGDHAAVLFPNNVDTLLSYVSVIKAGGTAIPINPLYTPREIEEVLYTHPAVYEAAVIGVPDEVKGEIPKAFLTLKPGQQTSEKEIVDFCKQNLASYKVPRRMEIRSELPKSSTGKILHRELRKA